MPMIGQGSVWWASIDVNSHKAAVYAVFGAAFSGAFRDMKQPYLCL